MATLFKLLAGMIAAGIVVTVLVVVGAARGIDQLANSTAGKVVGVADTIASFTLPDGYRPEYTVSLAGYTVAAYNNGDGHSHLILAQAPAGSDLDQARLEETLGKTTAGRKDRYSRMTVIEKRPVVVRGQPTTLVISEGTNSDGDLYREATAAFQGKGGPALLVISEPVTRWDMERVMELVGSIK